MEYYLCDYETHKALRGPWPLINVVGYINAQKNPKKFCNMSRYLLAKEGLYPRNKDGNKKLENDIKEYYKKHPIYL